MVFTISFFYKKCDNRYMKIIKKILLIIITIFILLMLGITILFVVNNKSNKFTYVFNYSSFMVYGSSMNPTIYAGDLVIIKKQDIYMVDDIISYKDKHDNVVTHRIININNNIYETKGDHNLFADSDNIKNDKIYGKVVLIIPNVKIILNFLLKYKYILIGGVVALFGVIIVISNRGKYVRRNNS